MYDGGQLPPCDGEDEAPSPQAPCACDSSAAACPCAFAGELPLPGGVGASPWPTGRTFLAGLGLALNEYGDAKCFPYFERSDMPDVDVPPPLGWSFSLSLWTRGLPRGVDSPEVDALPPFSVLPR